MLKALAERGYTKASGFSFEYYSLSHYQGAAKNLWNHRISKQEYDLIFITGTLAAKSFREVAWQSPKHVFVYAAVTDPVGLELIEGYDQAPQGNFTGVGYHLPVEIRMNFVKELIPNVKNIGIVHADMPQAHSYRKWLEDILKQEAWQGVKLHYRQVDFIPSEGGHRRMAHMAQKYIKELDPIVDVFLGPSDQMGAQSPFAKMVYKTATKPLIGIGKNDVFEGWGATASIYPDETQIGLQAASMVERIFNGQSITEIYPEPAKYYGIVIDKHKAEQYGLSISADLRKKSLILE